MTDKNPLAGLVSAAAEQLRTPAKPVDRSPRNAAPPPPSDDQQGSEAPGGAADRPPAQRRRRVRYEDRYRRATFFFDPDQLDRLDQFAYDHNLSKSEIIRTALDDYLDRG